MFSVSTKNNPTHSIFVELGSELAPAHRQYKGSGITVIAEKKQSVHSNIFTHSLKQKKCTHEMSSEVIITCLFVNICFLTKEVRLPVALRSSGKILFIYMTHVKCYPLLLFASVVCLNYAVF